jgi:hypothetical protein
MAHTIHGRCSAGVVSSRETLNELDQTKPLSRFDQSAGAGCGPCIVARHLRRIGAVHIDHVAGELLAAF